MKRGALAAIVMLGAIDSAGAHCYSVWRYPRPQHCGATALARAIRLPRERIDVMPPSLMRGVDMTPEIPLPSLTEIDWGQPPDDDTRGRLLLRVIMQGREDR